MCSELVLSVVMLLYSIGVTPTKDLQPMTASAHY